MLIYQAVKSEFMNAVEEDIITDQIDEKMKTVIHRGVSPAERRSWENSLKYMYFVMQKTSLPDNTGIAIEYNIPQTSKRIDFMVSGYDELYDPNVVIIELKQWENAKSVEGREGLVETFVGSRERKVVHPSYQAMTYSLLLKDYNASVQDRLMKLHPCCYLHNFELKNSPDILAEQYQNYVREAPVFFKKQGGILSEYLSQFIKKGDNREVLYDLERGQVRPAKSLQNCILSLLKGNQEFYMIDDQKVVYEEILFHAKQAKNDNKKTVILVKGGPGTGKSVVAVNLLAALTIEDNQFAQYTTKNAAPREVYLEKLTAKAEKGHFTKERLKKMFTNPVSYYEKPDNMVDTVLCDEAHRLVDKTRFTPNSESQVKDIIHAARCSVFFLDENQRVTFEDTGSEEIIEKYASEENAELVKMKLKSQFRCNGSDGYLAWIDNALDIRKTANYTMDGIDYDLRILDTPDEVFELIKKRNAETGPSRMVAGYCWNWDGTKKDDPNYHDIKIGDFEMSWNLNNYQSAFAIDQSSIDQAGCIHTTQGLEFDYVGVIIGMDLRYEFGKLITDPTARAKTDQSLRGYKKMLKTDPKKANKRADEIIRNTYRTLMTRGMKGCYIYCCDKNLAEYLRRMI